MAKQSKKEQKLQTQISDYIRNNYPTTDFLCDVAAGMKMSMFMAVLVKRWRSTNGLPDVYIFERRGQWNNLFLELKSEDAKLYKKDGTLVKDEHLENQQSVHVKMRSRGNMAMFVKGIDHAIAVVDWYMKGAEGNPPQYVERKEQSLFAGQR